MTVCAECAAEWGGQRTGHCTRCHRTFSTETNFEAHLIIDKGPGVYKVTDCVDPINLLKKDGSPRFKARRNAHGTDVYVSADTYNREEAA